MMAALIEMHCVPPKKGDQLSDQEMTEFTAQVPEWSVVEKQGVPQISRAFKFKNFSQALAFSVQIGVLAEKEDHHPALLTEWGKVTVTLWTHHIQGLHRNDFILAAKADQIYSS
jgi:4a-hydroxytetrahydrobiopterin dehydratase